MAEVKRWIKQAEQAGWRVSNVTATELRLACSKQGCKGHLVVSLNNPGPAPDPCQLEHVAGYSAAAFDDYRALVAILAKRRRALGLDQQDLNAILGMADGYVAKLESFARVATLPTLQLWAQCLGLELTASRTNLPPQTAAAIQRRSIAPYRPEMVRSKHATT